MVNEIDAKAKRLIAAAIVQAEKGTSGQIRVHLASRSVEDAYVEAQKTFRRLGMDMTRQKNGVLIYVAPHSKRFAVVGDTGIHAKVGPEFWSVIRDRMAAAFSSGRFAEGIVDAVLAAGQQLRKHFPRRPGGVNELPDTVTEDK